MQTQNPFLDEFAKLTTAAMGIAQAAGDEAKTAFRAQADKWAAELDLVRREDFDALKAELAAVRAELAALKASGPDTTKTQSAPRAAAAPKATAEKPQEKAAPAKTRTATSE